MNITFDLPPRAVNALLEIHEYRAQIYIGADLQNPVPNPETPGQFVRRKVIETIKQSVIEFEDKKRKQAALDAITPDPDLVIT